MGALSSHPEDSLAPEALSPQDLQLPGVCSALGCGGQPPQGNATSEMGRPAPPNPVAPIRMEVKPEPMSPAPTFSVWGQEQRAGGHVHTVESASRGA